MKNIITQKCKFADTNVQMIQPKLLNHLVQLNMQSKCHRRSQNKFYSNDVKEAIAIAICNMQFAICKSQVTSRKSQFAYCILHIAICIYYKIELKCLHKAFPNLIKKYMKYWWSVQRLTKLSKKMHIYLEMIVGIFFSSNAFLC